jgi:hypothetical protein
MLIAETRWISRVLLGAVVLVGGVMWGAPTPAVIPVPQRMPMVNRDRLPPALRNVSLEHLSSGALMLLNHNDLVQAPAAWFSQTDRVSLSDQTGSVPLVARLGSMIRLNEDSKRFNTTVGKH